MNINEQLTAIVKAEVTPILEAIATASNKNMETLVAEMQAIKALVAPPTGSTLQQFDNMKLGDEFIPPVEDKPHNPEPVKEEAPAVTYDDLIGNGWTRDQVIDSEYAHLVPVEPEDTTVELAAQADAIINAAIARMPQGATPGSYNESCVFHIAQQFGQPTLGDVADTELIENPDKVEAGIVAALTSIEKMGSKLDVPPPPPGKSAPPVTAPALNATEQTPAAHAPVAVSNSTETELVKNAAAGGSVPPAPVFTPAGTNPV